LTVADVEVAGDLGGVVAEGVGAGAQGDLVDAAGVGVDVDVGGWRRRRELAELGEQLGLVEGDGAGKASSGMRWSLR
jgi:hypothetical protein